MLVVPAEEGGDWAEVGWCEWEVDVDSDDCWMGRCEGEKMDEKCKRAEV